MALNTQRGKRSTNIIGKNVFLGGNGMRKNAAGNEKIRTTDGNFLDEMKAMEREILMEIDPEALAEFDREEREAAAKAKKEGGR